MFLAWKTIEKLKIKKNLIKRRVIVQQKKRQPQKIYLHIDSQMDEKPIISSNIITRTDNNTIDFEDLIVSDEENVVPAEIAILVEDSSQTNTSRVSNVLVLPDECLVIEKSYHSNMNSPSKDSDVD